MLLINFGLFVVSFYFLPTSRKKILKINRPWCATDWHPDSHTRPQTVPHSVSCFWSPHTTHSPRTCGIHRHQFCPCRLIYTSKPTHLKSISKFWRVQSPSHGAHFFLVESMKQPTQKIKDTHAARGTLSTPADDTHPSCPAQYSFLVTGYHPHSTWFCIFNALLDLDYTSLYFNEVECGGDVWFKLSHIIIIIVRTGF